jgi:hypothetical protein
MIIWSRWGILVLPFIGLGVLIGFAIWAIVGSPGSVGSTSNPATGIFIGIGIALASVGLYFFDREVMQKHLDKPRPMMLTQQFNPPITNPDGTLTYARQVPAVHPETGQPVVVRPTSSLFFIPIRFWPYLMAAGGVVVVISSVISLARR